MHTAQGHGQKPVSFWGSNKTLHIVLAIFSAGMWLVVPLTIWLWRTGRRRSAAISGGAIALLFLVIAISSGTSGSSTDSDSPNSPSSSAGTTETEATVPGESTCDRFVVNVEGYNTLLPGASRGEYLTLLHKLQRDCAAEALQAGLTGEGLPQCTDLGDENCTMYKG